MCSIASVKGDWEKAGKRERGSESGRRQRIFHTWLHAQPRSLWSRHPLPPWLACKRLRWAWNFTGSAMDVDICLLSPMQRKICSFFQPTQPHCNSPPLLPLYNIPWLFVLKLALLLLLENMCFCSRVVFDPLGVARMQRKTHACNLLFRPADFHITPSSLPL